MSSPLTIQIKRIDDATIFRVFKEAEEAGNVALEKFNNKNSSNPRYSIEISFDSALPWDITDDDIRHCPAEQYTVSEASLRFLVSWQDQRQNQQRTSSVSFRLSRGTSGDLTDTITINSNDQGNLNNELGQAVQRAMHKTLSVVLQPMAPEDGGLVSSLSNLSRAFDTTYQRISTELSNTVAAVSRERADQIADFQAERQKLYDEVAAEREQAARSAKQELESERANIAEEKQRLKDEWAKLEVSSHKDARRKQFTKLQEDLRGSLSTPIADSGLRKMRWAVFAALLVAGGAAGYFAFLSFSVATWETTTASKTTENISPIVMLVIRSVLLTVASLTAFFGAAAWMRYFYNRDMLAHEEIRRFQNDMARASWVMDAALEIRKEHDEQIPPEWISGVTQGLFSASSKENLGEGAQALAALVGLSGSASVGANGFEVQLNRKGRKAIADALDD